VLTQGGFEKLHALGEIAFNDSHERPHNLLTAHEVQVLQIPRGFALGRRAPRDRIARHPHLRFLSQIPWTRDLRRVPEIAYAHHEKLDGKGYPRSIPGGSIPVQSKMMAIADIYDALHRIGPALQEGRAAPARARHLEKGSRQRPARHRAVQRLRRVRKCRRRR